MGMVVETTGMVPAMVPAMVACCMVAAMVCAIVPAMVIASGLFITRVMPGGTCQNTAVTGARWGSEPLQQAQGNGGHSAPVAAASD
jgi:hypothetical protein